MAKKIWSHELNCRLIQMFESGKFATSEMADLLGVSVPTVYSRLDRMGFKTAQLPRRHRAAVKFEFSDEEKLHMIRLANDGYKVTQIAVKIQRTVGPTRRIFRELGLKTGLAKPLQPGVRFGALTVIAEAPKEKTYKGHFESRSHVVCDCGKAIVVFNYNLRTGNTKSCGCKIHVKNPDREWIRIRCGIESGARFRGLEMKLLNEQIKYLGQLSCSYCGAPPMNEAKGRKHGRSTGKIELVYTGIDRVDSTKGYVPGNVLPCCRICNRAKSNVPLNVFIGWLARFGCIQTASGIWGLCDIIGKQLQHL